MSGNLKIFFGVFFIINASKTIPANVLTDVEQSLQSRLDNMSSKLKKNWERLDTAFDSVSRQSRKIERRILFHARLTKNYSPMSPNQIIPFESTTANVGNGYDANFGLFRAPVPGFYQFVLTNQAEPNSYMVNLEMVKNGNMLCRSHAATYGQEGYCVAMVHLNKDDDVWVRHYNNQGTYLYAGDDVPTFSGHLINED